MCRCHPLKGNRIAADFGNKDSSNKNEKPSLSGIFNKATKLKKIRINGILFIAIREGLELFQKMMKVKIENKLGSATLTLTQCIDAFLQVWKVVMAPLSSKLGNKQSSLNAQNPKIKWG